MATYYVSSSTGSNSNNGTSSATPFRNLCGFATTEDAVASPLSGTNYLQPGDTVKIKRGDTWNGLASQWTINSSGSSSGYITFETYGEGPRPRFIGGRTATDLGLTWSLHSGNIYKATYAPSTAPRALVQDETTPLWRAGGLASSSSGLTQMVAGTFFHSAGVLYVWCTDGADPTTHTIHIATHPTDDNFRGLVKVKKDGAGSYIKFRDLEVWLSNAMGFTSSGEFQEFWNCKAQFTAKDCFYFIKNAVTAPGAQYNLAAFCEAQYGTIAGGGNGQNFTSEAPYVTWIFCRSENGGMAGFDLLDYNSSTDVQYNKILWCQSHNNGRSITTIDNYDPGIYLDGASNSLVYGCVTSGAGMNTSYDAPGISVDVEPLGYGNGKRANNNSIINCLSYNSRGEAIRIGQITGGNSVTAIDNLKIINCTFDKQGTGGDEMCYFRATNSTIKNNVWRCTVDIPMIYKSGTTTGLTSDYNVFYKSTGTTIVSEGGTTRTFSAWQGLGYDAHSVNTNPLLTSTTAATFDARLGGGSPALALADKTAWTGYPAITGTVLSTNALDSVTSPAAGFHYNSQGFVLDGMKLSGVTLT